MSEQHPGQRQWWDVPFSPIRITGIIEHEITGRAELGRGHGYKIPFSLSGSTPTHWEKQVAKHWDDAHPGGGPSIYVTRDKRIELAGVTVEEVRDTHLAALKSAVAAANEDEAKHRAEAKAAANKVNAQRAADKEARKNVIADMDFD